MQLYEIPISRITGFDHAREHRQVDIELLANSISVASQIIPILVYPVSEGYRGIYGKGRFEAIQKTGQDTVLAIVADKPSDAEALWNRFIENESHERMGMDERATALGLMHDHGMSIENISHQTMLPIDTVRKLLIQSGRIQPRPYEKEDIRASNSHTIDPVLEKIRKAREKRHKSPRRSTGAGNILPSDPLIGFKVPPPVHQTLSAIKSDQEALEELKGVLEARIAWCKKLAEALMAENGDVRTWIESSEKYRSMI